MKINHYYRTLSIQKWKFK